MGFEVLEGDKWFLCKFRGRRTVKKYTDIIVGENLALRLMTYTHPIPDIDIQDGVVVTKSNGGNIWAPDVQLKRDFAPKLQTASVDSYVKRKTRVTYEGLDFSIGCLGPETASYVDQPSVRVKCRLPRDGTTYDNPEAELTKRLLRVLDQARALFNAN